MKSLNGKELAAVLEARAAQDLELCNIAAASVLVMQEGEVLYKNHFFAKGSCWDRIGDRTLFRLASMTKPITGVATMLLVEKGLLSLEDTVDRFYPEFASLQILNEDGSLSKSSKKITVRDLLTHSSGIASGHASSFSDKLITPKDRESVENFVTFLSRQPLSCASPRIAWKGEEMSGRPSTRPSSRTVSASPPWTKSFCPLCPRRSWRLAARREASPDAAKRTIFCGLPCSSTAA